MTKAERTRRFIIEKSAPIINRKGMAGTSLSDIMEATKLAKGGIYGNFESKDEICTEAFFYLADLLSGQLDRAISRENTAKTKFFALLDAYRSMKAYDGGCPILNFGMEADDTHPKMKEHVRKALKSSQERIFKIVSNGIDSKEISEKINAKNFSIKVFAMIEGAILCKRLLESDEQMKVILEAVAQEFETYLL
jgi:TetR/AcrR family transcriptional repressor of nem operon